MFCTEWIARRVSVQAIIGRSFPLVNWFQARSKLPDNSTEEGDTQPGDRRTTAPHAPDLDAVAAAIG
jgi:hypothetical protein